MGGTKLTVDVLSAGDGVQPSALADLVNRVYAVSETGLWRDGWRRTSPEEMAHLVASGEIAVARLDGRVVGCVRTHTIGGEVGEFGLLAGDPEHRGIGIGRELVAFSERLSRTR